MSLELFGCNNIREKIKKEKEWMKTGFADCPFQYHPEAKWIDNAIICRLSLLEAYCDKYGLYQILNKEFNDSLADEIKKLALTPILEVGAGTGELTSALRMRGIDIHAVDSYVNPLPERVKNNPDIELPEKMDYRHAIQMYKPELIICSWMPPGEDWSVNFRDCESVKAYILIGDQDGNCGTRAIYSEFPNWSSYVLKGPNTWSLCRKDIGVDFEKPEIWWRHSKVVIYRRD